jgi:P-type Cu+ transporter
VHLTSKEITMRNYINKAIRSGTIATVILLVVYVTTVSLVSGWEFMLDQFRQFWYFVVSLAIGFGIQVGLYSYLRNAIRHQNTSGRVLAMSGTTSTAAMISCCAHYLVNLLPILGTVGIITIITQYQVQLFWVGLVFNVVGILYMLKGVIKYTRGI